MSRFAVIASVFLGCAAFGAAGVASAADEAAAAPQVSRGVAKFLKAAQDANLAKNFPEAIARLKDAQATQGRSPYDDYVINSLLFQAYGGMGDSTNAIGPIEAVIASSYAPATTRSQLERFLLGVYAQQKNYDKVLAIAERLKASGDAGDDIALIVATTYYQQNKFKEAAAATESIVEKQIAAGKKPVENNLLLLWQSARNAKDDGLAAKAVEQLILYYPKPDYWQNAMAGAMEKLGNDDRLKLMTFRLANSVGILKQGGHFRDMALIAIDQGNPGEAQAVLEQAFAKNLFTDPRDKDSNTKLLDSAKKKAAADKASIAGDEKAAADAPTGDPYVQIGAAYLGFGQVDKAISAINAGIAKGKLKYPDEAYLLLGIAQEKSKNNAEAIKAFNKVTADQRYVRLAKLWVLEVRS
jgi:hypothetical protein